jgi:alpha-tubulin suppressor-like RCC1 family protein
LKSDGTVWAWGSNSNGQLGDGTTGAAASKSNPVQVVSETNDPFTGVIAVAAGANHSLAMRNDGTVWTWGYNNYGQLGNGTSGSGTNKPTPVKVTVTGGEPLENVKAVAAGQSHSVALKSDGTVWSWGYNYAGQLGDGTTENSNRAVQVTESSSTKLTKATAVAAGDYFTVVLKEDGTVWSCGQNSNGQLGNGTTTSSNRAVRATIVGGAPLTEVTAVAAGQQHSVALKSDGTVWSWGRNDKLQLGDGTAEQRVRATQVMASAGVPFAGAAAITAGNDYSVALKSDGTVWAWGDNNIGKLGDGTTSVRIKPVQTVLGDGKALNLTGGSGGGAGISITVIAVIAVAAIAVIGVAAYFITHKKKT